MNDTQNIMFAVILIPAVFAALVLVLPSRVKWLREAAVLTGAAANFIANLFLFGKEAVFTASWCGFGIDFSLRLYQFSRWILFFAGAFSFLVVLYSAVFLKNKPNTRGFYAGLLFTLAFANGAVLANNLAVMLFFWEGILATMYIMVLSGGGKAHKTATKAIVIGGLSDLCLMLGIAMAGYLAKTLTMDSIHLSMDFWGTFAFILMMIGAISKAGAMPFHTWIPDAADDAPMPFLSFLPGTLEKLLGIYLLARVCLDLFDFQPGSSMSMLLMIIGAATVLFAVMMALIQKDFKRLLSYHAISQVGYMILGIGTALPIGIVGGLFHMLNHAVYKCCLFFTAGSVERQAGTTDLKKIGGLGKKMPVTFVCFLIAAASIAGFPLTNGFFSKELIFDGALETNVIFYLVALIGAFFTSVSFLKLGHAAFFGKPQKELDGVKEAPWPMLVPMIILSGACLFLGFGHSLVIEHVIQPILGALAPVGEAIGAETNWLLVGISVAVMALAVLDHYYGFKKTGKGLSAADHFHYAPALKNIYEIAEKKYFDPYYVGGIIGSGFSAAALKINDGISWFYDVFVVRMTDFFSKIIRKAHTGNQALYVAWVLAGILIIAGAFWWQTR